MDISRTDDSSSYSQLEIFFDGLCQPYNPGGIACYAFIIKKQKKLHPKIIHSEFGLAAEPFTDNATNNVAEYTGVIKALEWLLGQRRVSKNNYSATESITIKGDSQLVVYQIKGRYKVKATKIIPLYQRVTDLISKFNKVHVEWIPREENSEADKLTNYAYMKIIDSDPELKEKISHHMATNQQLEFLKNLGITPEKYLSKIEANRLISRIKKAYV
ncbi:MAG TPA: ribonuclease HI [Nitrososphaeraceae archaeon]|jgi:ribonuclease HI|nr:ribonuclease HI [Nitrososphaeraceae archaeon]